MLNFRSHLNRIYKLATSFVVLACTSQAWADTSPSTFNPNSNGAAPTLSSSNSNQSAENSIGSLPSSNQWLYDRASTFLYLSYDSLVLNSQTLTFGNYSANLGSTGFKYLALDSFMRLASLASPEGTSIFGKFAFWGEFSLGLGERDASLTDTDIQSALTAESSSLTTLLGKVGIQFVYDYPSWIKPYIGMSATWYGYRNSSSMSGAVAQGSGSFYGPVAGLHLPLTFLGRVSLYGEVQKVLATPGSGQIFADSTNFNGGVGFTF